MKKLFLSFIIIFLTTLISCSEENENIKLSTSAINVSPPITNLTYQVPDSLNYLKQFLINDLKYKKEEIHYTNNEFIIQSDIAIPIDNVKKMLVEAKQKDSSNLTRHRAICSVNSPIHSGCIRSKSNRDCDRSNEIYNIYIWISSVVPNSWEQATIEAMNEWNNLTNNRIRFIRVDEGLACTDKFFSGIRIHTFQEGNTNVIARAQVGHGSPGDYIKINTLNNYYNSSNINALTRVITHELGHSIGYYHTNESDGCFINGSNANDSFSVMNSSLNPVQTGFSTYDVSAHNTLYPMANNSAANIYFGNPNQCN